MAMNHNSKENLDADMIAAFIKNGGKITKGKTKDMPNELRLSNASWNNPLTREEKKAKGKKI
jgi:hypothetical protein